MATTPSSSSSSSPSADPVLVTLVQDVLRVLSQNEGCRQPLQQRIVPTLVSILDAPEDKVALGLKVRKGREENNIKKKKKVDEMYG